MYRIELEYPDIEYSAFRPASKIPEYILRFLRINSKIEHQCFGAWHDLDRCDPTQALTQH